MTILLCAKIHKYVQSNGALVHARDLCGINRVVHRTYIWLHEKEKTKMGRPIRKDRMLQNQGGSAGTNRIAVTAYRPSGGSKVDSTVAYIVSQRGSKLFKIHLDDSSEAIYELKAVAPADLGNTSNQFCVQIILNDSTVAYVEKFYNNTVHWVDSGGNTGHSYYSLGAEGTDEGGGAGEAGGIKSGSIDVV